MKLAPPNARRWAKQATLLALLGAAPLLAASCRGATQITLNVHTNVPCTSEQQWRGVAVYVGKPGAGLERTSPTLVTRSCDARGNVGSLVIVPSAEKDEEIGLRVVAGLSVNPEDCPAGYDGCIVARRTLRFNPHTSLVLDVELAADCVSIGCDAQRTCLAGDCVDSREVEPTPDPPQVEPEITGPSVRCGDNGVRCRARTDASSEQDVCCLTVNVEAQTTLGDCRPARDCPPSRVLLNCDDDTDCPPAKEGSAFAALCALSYTYPQGRQGFPDRVYLSDCRFASHESIGDTSGLALCQERKACNGGAAPCNASVGDPLSQLPGYFWCPLAVP